jgi:cyclophilin family peptidyl-prolyl cis-trans isomerase
MEAIGSLPGEGRLPLITRGLRDKSPHVVAVAAHELFDAAELFEVEELPTQNLTVTEHTPEGAVVHKLTEAGVERPPVPVKRVISALKRVDPDQHPETAINLAKAVGRIGIEKAADAVRPLASHHSPAIRKEGRRALKRLGVDPGPEIAPDPPRLVDPTAVERLVAGDPVEVEVETTAGTFAIRLRADLSPATAANFLDLVRRGFYDGVTFHRVVPGFVVQVGDPTGTGYGGPGYTIRCEVTEKPYVRGSVGMALAGPDTGGSQIFIAVAAQPHLERRYTLFAEVSRGMEVVDAIQQWDHIVRARVAGEEPAPAAAPAAAPDGGPDAGPSAD